MNSINYMLGHEVDRSVSQILIEAVILIRINSIHVPFPNLNTIDTPIQGIHKCDITVSFTCRCTYIIFERGQNNSKNNKNIYDERSVLIDYA
jgi:hypothetical protein